MVAFSTGAALLIAAGQLKTVLGLPGPKPAGFFPQIWFTFQGLGRINWWCLGLALLTIVLILALRRVSRRFPATLGALALVGARSRPLSGRRTGRGAGGAHSQHHPATFPAPGI